MISGTINITNDPELILALSSTHTIICVSGETSHYRDLIHASNAMVASILLPPYEALVADIDGDMETFKNIYFSHLSNGEAFEYLLLIIRAIFDGKHILLFTTKTESEMSYVPAILEYMYFNFGIMIGTETNSFALDHYKYHIILELLFMHDLLDLNTFIYLYPADIPIQNQYVVSKAMNILPPHQGTMEEFVLIVNDMKNRSKVSGSMPIIPVGRVRE